MTANYVPNLTGTGDVSDALAALNAANEALERARTAVTTAQTNLQTLSNTAYEKSAAASDAETEYENALGAYNTALSRYNHTKYAYDLANSMATATENLYKAADDRAIFQAQYEAAEQAMKDAWSDAITDPATPATINSVSGKAANMLTTYKSVFDMGGTAAEGNQLGDNSPVSFKKLFGDTSNAPTEGTSLAKKINDLYTQYYDSSLGAMENQRFGSMKSNMDKMHTLWGEMVNLLATGTAAVGDPGDANYVPANPGIIANMNRLKDGAAGNVDGGVDDVEAALIRTQLAADLATLKQKMSDYQRAYAKLADAAAEAGEAALTGAVVGSAVAAVASTKTAADELFDVGFRTPTAGDKDLEQLLKDYESAYKTWHDMSNTTETDPAAGQPVSTVGQANKAWKNAVDAYNNAITTAESTYTTNIEKTQPTLNDYFRITNDDDKYLTDQTAGIVGDAQNKGYLSNVSSANDEDKISTENGKFDTATNGYPDYKLYTIPSGVATAKTGGGYEVKPYDANDTTHTGKQRVSPATSTYTQIGIDADHKEAVNGAAPTA